MVIVKIWGGLGNQLFQYSFGQYLAHKLGTTVKYDIQLANRLSSFVSRDFALGHFNVQAQAATAAEVDAMKYFQHVHWARVERKLAQQLPTLFKHHIVEHNFPRPPEVLPARDDCYYEGYWQSLKYVAPVEKILRSHFTLKENLSQQAQEINKKIESSHSVGIHVRRADYLTTKNYEACSIEYYQKAIAYLKERFAGLSFFVFTDDVPWCQSNFTGNEFTVVSGNRHFEDMALMSRCHHNIIANSSFSWWAAWLNEHRDKLVIAPEKWHVRHNEKKAGLFPVDWIKIC
jgi:Glycosyl transferase family 11